MTATIDRSAGGAAPAGETTQTGTGPDSVRVWIEARRREIDGLLAARLGAPDAGDDPGRLVEAMRYSLLAPGKRLRPLLALAAAEAVGAPPDDEAVRTAAAAVELVHCYSLIHDDLPAMDDDDFRRGRPSSHKVFGDATAILAGDALLTLAFEWLAEAGARSGRPQALGLAALALARGAGKSGMVRGQARDLGEPPPDTIEGLERLHAEKTAALFRAALEVGGAAAGASRSDLDALGAFGLRFGVAFQHADDLGDGDRPLHAAAARDRLGALISEATSALDRLAAPARAGVLRALADRLRSPG
jgi:geranylgeranyl pyrophosphate synthase